MSARLADFIFRFRYPLCAFIVLGALYLAPKTNITEIDNEISMWISKDDPIYQTYERFRQEFGGQRLLLVALRSESLFTAESLEFIRTVTDDIERVPLVERVQSLSTANIVTSLPPDASGDDAGGIEVQPLLEDDLRAPGATERVRRRALNDRLLRGDLISDDGTVTVLVVSFDEGRIDDERADIIERIHQLIDPRLPRGMEALYNGSLEISETYNRVTLDNTRKLTPPILLLTIGGIFLMFRSWRITALLVVAVLVSAIWTMGLFVQIGFTYNVLASMLPPLVIILAIADDVHIVQHFNHELRATGSKEHAFKSSVRHLFAPLLGASGTTALGLLSLATSDVVAVQSFGIGAAVGVMVDFVMSLVFVPTLLMFLEPETGVAPQERYLIGPMQAVSRFSMRHAAPIAVATIGVLTVASVGISRLRVDTNHINFFADDHPIHRSAVVIDEKLSGIYSFNVLLEGPPESMKTPDALQRMERLRVQLEGLPFVKKVVSLADYVKRVNAELQGSDAAMRPASGGIASGGTEVPPLRIGTASGGTDRLRQRYGESAKALATAEVPPLRTGEVLPDSAEAIAQELFVFGLSDEGRRELARVTASDYSRAQISVKLASMSSDLVFEQIDRAEAIARDAFAGSEITPVVTGSGRLFATLDHYIVISQLSSFATAFVTVFAVIFVVFRSARFGVLGIVANALPVAAVLGLMGWLDISLNVATVMVASVALGIVDDDTIHFIGRFRREAAGGASTEQAIETATMHEGRASLTTAIINSLAYGIMIFSSYKPTAWFGGLLALTMMVAFLAEVLVVPAVIMMMPRMFGAPRFARTRTAA